jgi:hypothetical protein
VTAGFFASNPCPDFLARIARLPPFQAHPSLERRRHASEDALHVSDRGCIDPRMPGLNLAISHLKEDQGRRDVSLREGDTQPS